MILPSSSSRTTITTTTTTNTTNIIIVITIVITITITIIDPCVKAGSKFKEYKGHSEHIPNVRFSSDGNRVFSVGGLDKAVIQFEVKRRKNKVLV